MSWTDHRVDLLKKLWADGLSGSQCAVELGGGISRCAVIGKITRLGLVGRQTAARARSAQRKRVERKPLRVRLPDHSLPPFEIAPALQPPWSDQHKIHFLSFTHDHRKCSWPLWNEDVPLDEKFYCGAKTTGSSLCWFHSAMAYSAPPERKRPYWSRNGKTS